MTDDAGIAYAAAILIQPKYRAGYAYGYLAETVRNGPLESVVKVEQGLTLALDAPIFRNRHGICGSCGRVLNENSVTGLFGTMCFLCLHIETSEMLWERTQ